MPSITAVVFDLDDTLRYNDPHAHTFFCDFAETLGRPLTAEQRRASQLWEHKYWANSVDLITDNETFPHGGEDFWLNYSQRHLQVLGFADHEVANYGPQVHAHMRDQYQPQSRVRPEAVETLKQLRRAGTTLGVITNRTKHIHAEMHSLELDHHLDFYLTAAQLGAYKPQREIFDNLLRFVGGNPDEMIYVGDNYFADVQGARNAGIRPILLNWNDLYPDADCEEIKSLAELPALLQLEAVS